VAWRAAGTAAARAARQNSAPPTPLSLSPRARRARGTAWQPLAVFSVSRSLSLHLVSAYSIGAVYLAEAELGERARSGAGARAHARSVGVPPLNPYTYT